MNNILYNIFVYVVEMLIAFAFYSKNYNKKISSTTIVLCIGLLLFVPSAFLFVFFNNEIINLVVFFAINLFFGLLCFDIPLKSAILQSVILDSIMYASELITIFLSSSVMGYPIDTYRNNLIAYIVLSSISKIIYLIFSQILSFLIKKDNLAIMKIKYFLPLFIFPVLTLITSSVFLFLALEIELSVVYQTIIFLISTLFIFSCIFMFIYYQMLLEKEAKIDELESEQKINSINKSYLDILEQQNDELQMMFHDTKHHYITLGSFENINDVKNYIETLYPILEEKNKARISNNKMIDIIVNKYIMICGNAGIKFSYEVKTSDLSYIDSVVLSAILNNALDNAIEAAQNSKEKTVDFSLRHINNMDMLSVVNSCDHSPEHVGNRLITTKKHVQSHGYGSKIIKRNTEENNGKYEWFYDKIDKKFHLTLLFQNNINSKKQVL